ncbi:MAG: secretin N-terminal domain-containing protein [Planctomycetaceae bacterium]
MLHLITRRVCRACLTILLTLAAVAPSISHAADGPEDAPAKRYTVVDLSDARVAAELKLTDEQRKQAAALLQERAQTLAKAAEADKPAVITQSDQKLAALLTDEQKTLLADLKPEPRLRFNFRSQKWIDVLEWFAGQADLSLVLDAPPPGTFNYSDNKDYTPSEAIDLLNGVLQTKGYTLIRRDRMLVVANLTDGIPEGLVPRVTIEELDRRGKFELVSVMFPLGNRPAEEVAKEIKPLLGPQGKAVPLPKTKQLLVTDMAGIMRSVNAIITSIPEPQPPPTPAAPQPPEKPLLTVYPLKTADPNAAVEMLKILVEPAKAVYDPKSQQLNVFATPSQHAVVKTVVEQLQASTPPDKQPRLEVYPLETPDAVQLLENLRLIAPNAQMRIDAKTGGLIAWAAPDEHEKLKANLDKLGQAGTPLQARQVEVYPLTKADPNTTLALLQSLLPNARMSVDTQTRSLIAVAAPADQQVIKTTLSELQPDKPGPNATELRFYPFEHAPPASLTTVLATLAPRAQITADNDRKRLTVVASPADHEVIKSTIDRFQSAEGPESGREENKLEIYPVTPAQRKRFQAIVDSVTAELPGIRVIADAEPGELSIWAKPSQHAVLAGILDRLKRDVTAAEKFELAAYPIKASDPSSAMTILQELFPGTRIVVDVKTRRLLIWTRPEEHELIRRAVEQINSGVSPDMQETFRVYPLSDVDPAVAISMLQQLLPETKFSSDTVAKTILVWGRKSDHATVEKTLKQMKDAAQSTTPRTVVVYPIGKSDPVALVTALHDIAPNARINDHPRTGKLLAWGTPQEHEAIRATIEKLSGDDIADAAAEVVVYQVKSVGAGAALPILQSVVPQARYSYGADPEKIIAWASRSDHETIKQVVDKMEAGAKPGDGKVLAVYPLYGLSGTTLSQVLAPFQAKGAQIVSDATRDSLIIRADEEQQAAIKTAVEQLTAQLPKEKKPTSHVYRFQTADPYAAQTVLASLTPNARVAVDYRNHSIVVSAMPGDHEMIAATVADMDRAGTGAESPQMKSYRVESMNPATLQGMLQTLFAQYPEVRFAADVSSGTIAALATAPQHEKIQQVIDEVGKSEQGAISHVYRFERADPYAAITVMQTLTPNARMAVDTRNRSLVVSASAAEHKKIAETVAQMDKVDAEGQAPLLRSYPMNAADSYVAVGVLQTLFATSPEVRVSLDAKNDTIVALASAAQHETIKKSIEEMERQGQGRTSHVYRLRNGDPYAAATIFATLTPRAQVAVDTRSRTLVVSATAADHTKIKSTIEQMESDDKDGQAPQLKSYSLKSSDPTTLVTMLQTMYATHPEARFSADPKSGTVVAIATPAQHETIRALVDEVDGGSQGDQSATIEVYSLEGRDADSVLEMIAALTARQTPKVDLSLERQSNQLVAVARPEQHAMIRAAINRLQTDERQLEVFALEVVEPASAELAIETLFRNTDGTAKTNAPIVDSDRQLNQLYVRASKAQLDDIRRLLVKMGESDLAISGAGSEKRLRVVPFSGDTRAAVSEIERVWPQIRRNAIRVVVPSAVAPTLRRGGEQDSPSGHQPQPKPAVDPKAQYSVPPEEVETKQQPVKAVKPVDEAEQKALDSANAANEKQKSPSEGTSPVIISPGSGSITIASDDTEALNQLEALLRAMSRGTGGPRGRDYVVYSLRNASAERTALTLQQLFRSGGLGSSASGRVTVASDQRLNAIVVHGSRIDRETIEELLRVLDSPDVPDSLASNRPRLIPVKNTEAARIEEIVRDLYKSQLTQGGGRPPIPVPSGVSQEVAAAIQQANAAGSGPLLTLGVDELTNSLVVMAPATLFSEIDKLVHELDEAAVDGGARELTIIPLKKTNTPRVQEALQTIFGDRVRVHSPSGSGIRSRRTPSGTRTPSSTRTPGSGINR